MSVTNLKTITLEAFLPTPETKTPREYIDGQILPKPVPKSGHSRLQGKLVEAINTVTEPARMADALPERRCTFGGRSIVPNIAVFRWPCIAQADRSPCP
ncbi:MAG: Uma2 family endonuclease [Nodosilinea sp.]